MSTIANIRESSACHWYDPKTGKACHSIEKKDGSGLRPTTLRDARPNGWLPSSTSILKVLDKPALTRWKIEQACLSVLTAPRKEGEGLDEFVKRVLVDESQQDDEAAKARELGTNIHKAIELVLTGNPFDGLLSQYVWPVVDAVKLLGRVISTEKIVIGQGYAGCADCLLEGLDHLLLLDFKTCKIVPKKESYDEHRYQLASYAAALGNTGEKLVRTSNVYISTTNPGEIKVIHNPEWTKDFEAFRCCLRIWQLMNGYEPN